jgi:signal peptidase I
MAKNTVLDGLNVYDLGSLESAPRCAVTGIKHSRAPTPSSCTIRLSAIAGLGVATSIILALAGCGESSQKTLTYRVPSLAMLPTLKLGQVIHVDPAAYAKSNPAIGDIVAFHPPAGADSVTPVCGNPNTGGGHPTMCDLPTPTASSQTFLKRVVAGPGDRISMADGHIVRNRVRENEPYVAQCRGDPLCSFPTAVVVPPGDYFMLGDNRGASDDSRFWGPVPKAWIVGKMVS